MYVIYVAGEPVYAASSLIRFQNEVAKKYASVANAKLGETHSEVK